MARAPKRWRQRPQAGALGKDLTRRSRGRCELCEGAVGVLVWEIPPFPEDPELERALHACGRCRGWLEGEDPDPVAARFLEGAVWDERRPVALAAARLLIRIDGGDYPWTREALAAISVDPRTGEFVDEEVELD